MPTKCLFDTEATGAGTGEGGRMIRHLPGLSQASLSSEQLPDGQYLVRVAHVRYHWDKRKPYYQVRFEILQPALAARQTFSGRVYASVKALWKLSWFLRDFGYDPDLLGRDELNEGA